MQHGVATGGGHGAQEGAGFDAVGHHLVFAAAQALHADETARRLGLTPFISSQNELSLLNRESETTILPTVRDLGLGFLGLGFHPTIRRDQAEIMPKGRYDLMRRYMPTVGKLGLDMMLRTCTVQANLDFDSEADMVKKFRVSLALQPVATALFANSPFVEGKSVGFKSYRSHIWTDTDPDRCGTLPFALPTTISAAPEA